VAVSGIAPDVYAAALVRVVKELSRQPQAEAGLQLLPGVKRLKSRLQAVLQDETLRSPQIPASARLAVVVWALFALAGGSLMEACESSAPLAKLAMETATQRGSTIENGSRVRSAPRRAANHHPQRATRSARRDADRVGSDNRAEDRRAIESSMRQVPAELSYYEVGFLLGKRYSEERKMRLASGEETNPDPRISDLNTKRAIELQLQGLPGRLPER
jgi:hypothetical protein